MLPKKRVRKIAVVKLQPARPLCEERLKNHLCNVQFGCPKIPQRILYSPSIGLSQLLRLLESHCTLTNGIWAPHTTNVLQHFLHFDSKHIFQHPAEEKEFSLSRNKTMRLSYSKCQKNVKENKFNTRHREN